ncbi:MAG: putative inner rane protein [Labilithrix sp.]|nr:putative inner rane protein [Labilithrix sp.]
MPSLPTSSAPTKVTFREHPIEFLLKPFADVRGGEGPTVLLLLANVFLLLTTYYLLKVAREPLILMGGGAEVKSYAAAGQAFLLVIVAWAYGKLARRVGRFQLIASVSVFFAANLVLFWALGKARVALGVPFYLWVGIFSLTVIAQFWSFAADVYTQEQGKRLFAVIGIGSSVGAVLGAWIAKRLLFLGPYVLMLVAGGLLLVCLAITWVVHQRERHRSPTTEQEDAPLGGDSGFALVLRDRYLLAVGALAFVINWVNSNGEYILDRTLMAEAKAQAALAGVSVVELIGAFKADFFQWVNVVGVLCQLFVVSRVIKYAGVRRALFVMPIVSLGVYATLALAPLLGVIFVAKIAENSLDYSLQNTARQGLWLVTDREAKYKAKQVVDTFLVRAGDVMSAVVVWAGSTLGFATVHFIVGNIVLGLVWLFTLVLLAREHVRRSALAEKPEKPVSIANQTPEVAPAA